MCNITTLPGATLKDSGEWNSFQRKEVGRAFHWIVYFPWKNSLKYKLTLFPWFCWVVWDVKIG